MVVHAARTQDRVVGAHRRGPHPQIPVQPRFHLFFREVTGHPGRPETAFHAADRADHTVAHELAGHAKLLHRTLHRAGLQHAPVRGHRIHQRDRLVDVVGQRLLAIDVLAGFQRRDGGNRVPVIGRGDAHRVDVLAREHVPEIVVCGTVRRTGIGMLGVVSVDHFLRGGAAGGVDVAHGDHPADLAAQKRAEQVPALFAHADEAHDEPVVRRGFGAPDARRKDEGRGGKNRCSLEKRSAAAFHGTPHTSRWNGGLNHYSIHEPGSYHKAHGSLSGKGCRPVPVGHALTPPCVPAPPSRGNRPGPRQDAGHRRCSTCRNPGSTRPHWPGAPHCGP